MPTDATETHCIVHKNGTVTCMARVVGADGSAITQTDIDEAEYSIYLLDDQDPDSLTAVDEHEEVSLIVSDVVYDTLQTDDIWTKDSTGFNFKYTVDIGTNAAFTVAGRKYQIRFKLTPDSGQVIIVRFQPSVI